MNKQNTEKEWISPDECFRREKETRNSRAMTGSNRAETSIPGTTIPKRFYVTIVLDTKKLIEAPMFEWGKIIEAEFTAVISGAKEQIGDYRLRHRIFKFYGCDPGHGFEMKYGIFWMTTDDGVIQLLREDFLAIGTRAIDAEMDYLDGILENIDGVLKPVKE